MRFLTDLRFCQTNCFWFSSSGMDLAEDKHYLISKMILRRYQTGEECHPLGVCDPNEYGFWAVLTRQRARNSWYLLGVRFGLKYSLRRKRVHGLSRALKAFCAFSGFVRGTGRGKPGKSRSFKILLARPVRFIKCLLWKVRENEVHCTKFINKILLK